jgi:hypothetical protein
MKQGVHKTGTFSSSSDPFSLTTLTKERWNGGTKNGVEEPAWST